jgi:hypothetical protein
MVPERANRRYGGGQVHPAMADPGRGRCGRAAGSVAGLNRFPDRLNSRSENHGAGHRPSLTREASNDAVNLDLVPAPDLSWMLTVDIP